jgi:hypothetical protein
MKTREIERTHDTRALKFLGFYILIIGPFDIKIISACNKKNSCKTDTNIKI